MNESEVRMEERERARKVSETARATSRERDRRTGHGRDPRRDAAFPLKLSKL